jgi:hypothetical protein
MHVLQLGPHFNGDVGRYMSMSQSQSIQKAQKALMAKLQVPYLDLWETTYLSAFQTNKGDGIHYKDEFNKEFLNDYFFRIE